jgi:hypothetical protein
MATRDDVTKCWTEVAVTVLENGELIGRDSVNMVVILREACGYTATVERSKEVASSRPVHPA